MIKDYQAPSVRYDEILRYAGAERGAQDPLLLEQIAHCLGALEGRLSYRVCYELFPVRVTKEGIELPFARCLSKDLSKNLQDCSEVLLFAATVGRDVDRMMMRYGKTAPTKALLFSAIGSERIESLCDLFEEEQRRLFEAQGRTLRPRFSPGYGDLPLSLQREIFAVLQPQRHIGLTLNDSLLMSPCKSVTGFIGVSKPTDKP
ncbi:MAG: Vitamin B12 dependent methionine synthase activation subunit [Clostridia bacterium]|nr:Vitamin B12 dependent methionine synthase activation subunit [Clostridia bacterium]